MQPLILRRVDHSAASGGPGGPGRTAAPQGGARGGQGAARGPGAGAGHGMGGSAPRRDPAPSRAAYRLQRVWLTPSYRRILRIGLPMAIVIGALGAYFENADRREAVVAKFHEIQRSIETRPEFMVSMMSIDGATPPLAQAIRQVLDLKLPQSSFDLDLPALRQKIETLDAVADADLQVGSGGVLHVTIRERKGAIVWRTEGGLEMLDDTGHRVAGLVDRAARSDLPLIAGEGADKAVPQALALLNAAGALRARIRGLIRVSERRWNVVLDRDQVIELPQVAPVPALERVIALDHAQHLMSRDITVVDMRNEARPTVRLAPQAMEELRKERKAEAGGKTQ
ncbi:cell division protein FtsQ/DivIB [Acidimangrovimonas sediminis]|uniref:cell division protein FtsQ/DivIB n=1 Tax=Acidimangrovimonas sediminis TaxID=2056283 RepID=UPI0022B90126|nr:cell division protein FtsQ/DivIB [Acidimangrovimonas sediminis]